MNSAFKTLLTAMGEQEPGPQNHNFVFWKNGTSKCTKCGVEDRSCPPDLYGKCSVYGDDSKLTPQEAVEKINRRQS